MTSVVIPAHNEERVIGRCLRTLLDGAPGDVDVVVVANGCTDRTAAIAAAHGGPVRVVETSVASKVGALNLGDAHAAGFPRVYLDADVELSGASLHALATSLRGGGALAAAPAVHFALGHRPWSVRAYYRVWQVLPFARQAIGAGGVYGLSAEGRARFGPFPDLGADDLFVRQQFRADERLRVEGSRVVVHPPMTLRSLVVTRARVLAANREYRSRGLPVPPAPPGERGRGRSVVARPDLWPAAVLYAGVQAAARVRARARLRGAAPRHWERDETARAQA